MTHAAVSRGGALYGAADLKDTMQLYWMAGLGIAIGIHMAAIGSLYLTEGDPERSVQIHLIRETGLRVIPPPLNPTGLTNINVGGGTTRSRAGIPVPVPAAIVDSAVELTPNVPLNPFPGAESNSPAGVLDTVRIPTDAPPEAFDPVEGLPKLVRSASPGYPDLAVMSGLEGLVRVKILVDREGKPGAVSVVNSTADIFNDAAVAAAWKFRFTPGYTKNGPVPVSVEVPFRFRLADRK